MSLKNLRYAAGFTLDELRDRLQEVTGRTYTRGALSAVENGHRGASADLIAGLETAYGLPAGAIDTNYKPRREATRKDEL